MIIDKLFKKYQECMKAKIDPNSIVLPPQDFYDFTTYLNELELNDSRPLKWLENMQVFSSTGATEIKMGYLL